MSVAGQGLSHQPINWFQERRSYQQVFRISKPLLVERLFWGHYGIQEPARNFVVK
jgi:hypothetical protein